MNNTSRDRVRSLEIPPADGPVGSARTPTAGAGGEYITHPRRVLRLAESLRDFRWTADQTMRKQERWTRACSTNGIRVLDREGARLGHAECVEENGSYGVATLLREHVPISKDSVEVRLSSEERTDRPASG